jgi:hypothetical protein
MSSPDDVSKTLATAQHSPVVRQVMGAISATAGKGKSEAETRSAIQDAVGISASKLSTRDVSWLYRAVVLALIVVMVVALIALSWTILDRSDDTAPDLLLTVFTGALSALVGLFVRSPSE